VQLLKIFEEMGSSRQEEIGALRADIGELTGAIRELTRSASQPRQRPVPQRRAPPEDPAPEG
jgi:hypothetical protein